MAGEIIKAETLEEGKRQLMEIYRRKSMMFEEISEKEYAKIDKDEREDSDNHLNMERLGKDTGVTDLAWYKYLPDRLVAYRIVLKNKEGQSETFYFKMKPDTA